MGTTTASASFVILLVVLSTASVRHVRSEEQCHIFETIAIESSTEIIISSQNIPVLLAKCLQGFTKVVKLHLQNCKIQEIEPDALRLMENLQDVDLSNNLLTNLPENLFEHNKQLERVTLKNNKFTTVPHVAVPINKLDLSRNMISSLNSSRSLDVNNLDLSHNLLESLPTKDLALMNNVIAINLSNNRWKCGSQFDEILCWSLNKINSSSLIKCFTTKGKLITYTTHHRQEFCEINTQNPTEQLLFSSTEVPITVNSLFPKMTQSTISHDGEQTTEIFKRPMSDKLTSLQDADIISESPFGETYIEVTAKRLAKPEVIVPVSDKTLTQTPNKPNPDQLIPEAGNLFQENLNKQKSEQLEMHEEGDLISKSSDSISNYENRNISSEIEIYLRMWVVIAYIGWLFAGVAVTVLIYTSILVYYKKPYKRITSIVN